MDLAEVPTVGMRKPKDAWEPPKICLVWIKASNGDPAVFFQPRPDISIHKYIYIYNIIWQICIYICHIYIYFNSIFGDILRYTWTWFNIVESCWILLLVKSTWNSPMGFLHQIPPSFSSSEARASRRARAWRLWITVFRVRRAGWGNPLFNGRMANGTIIPCGIIAMFDYQRRYIIFP